MGVKMVLMSSSHLERSDRAYDRGGDRGGARWDHGDPRQDWRDQPSDDHWCDEPRDGTFIVSSEWGCM